MGGSVKIGSFAWCAVLLLTFGNVLSGEEIVQDPNSVQIVQVIGVDGEASFENLELSEATWLSSAGTLRTDSGEISLKFKGFGDGDFVIVKSGLAELRYGNPVNNPLTSGLGGIDRSEINYSQRFVRLQSGQLVVSLGESDFAQKLSYIFSTPELSSVSARQGSRFLLKRDQDKSILFVLRGRLIVLDDSDETTVEAGQTIQVCGGNARKIESSPSLASECADTLDRILKK